jgi:hypothetical protein
MSGKNNGGVYCGDDSDDSQCYYFCCRNKKNKKTGQNQFVNKGGMEMTSSHARIKKKVKENQPPEFENELL